MTTTSATSRRSWSAESSSIDQADCGQTPAGPFMLTLCHFEGPVSIRPPQAPQLKRFTFFTTRAPQNDGSEWVYLHMGYFETLSDAQNLLQVVRRRFPHATASPAPAPEESLTDTQVMRILEKRGVVGEQNGTEEASGAQVGMLRPDDTSTRLALKQAVAQGAPVFFAVQLDWSERPIDVSRFPTLPIFKTHTLYETESRREGRCRHFLRLGFFTDAASAKEAAFSVRSKFASAVVVPITEQEHTCAHEAAKDSQGLAHVCLPIYEAADRSAAANPTSEPRIAIVDRPRKNARDTETLEQTLETLAARELWSDPDFVNDTGVRHLKVEVMKRKSGRS